MKYTYFFLMSALISFTSESMFFKKKSSSRIIPHELSNQQIEETIPLEKNILYKPEQNKPTKLNKSDSPKKKIIKKTSFKLTKI